MLYIKEKIDLNIDKFKQNNNLKSSNYRSSTIKLSNYKACIFYNLGSYFILIKEQIIKSNRIFN